MKWLNWFAYIIIFWLFTIGILAMLNDFYCVSFIFFGLFMADFIYILYRAFENTEECI